MNAFSGVEYRLGGIVSRFQSDIGVDDESGGNGSVVFHVLADGTEIFNSGVMTGGAAHQSINLDVTGVNRLTLGVSDADDGNANDDADWAGALRGGVEYNACAAACANRIVCRAWDTDPLAWNPARSAVSYKIYRAAASVGPYTNIAASAFLFTRTPTLGLASFIITRCRP